MLFSGTVITAPPLFRLGKSRSEVQLAVGQPFDNLHHPGANRTAKTGDLWPITTGHRAEQFPATRQFCTPFAVGENAEVADANQATGQNVQQEAAQELMSGNGHNLLLAAVGIVAPAKRDAIVLKGYKAMVGNGDAMGIACQVVENMFGTAERWLGVDHPVLPRELLEEMAEATG